MRIKPSIFCVIFSALLSSSAQKPITHIPNPARPGAASVVRFNPEFDKLPENFRGMDADTLYKLLVAKSPGSRSEFETTQQYLDRVSKFRDSVFWGDLKPSDPFAFVLGQSGQGVEPRYASLYGRVETTYDADATEMTIKIPIDLSYYVMTKWATIWKKSSIAMGSYAGSNAFGAHKSISKFSDSTTELV